jgi:hypothetical protein
MLLAFSELQNLRHSRPTSGQHFPDFLRSPISDLRATLSGLVTLYICVNNILSETCQMTWYCDSFLAILLAAICGDERFSGQSTN